MARDVYEEGAVILPCVKVQSDYQDIDDVIRMCQVRIRVPVKWKGDYLALLGAARVGEREVTKLAGEVDGIASTRSCRRGSTTARAGWPKPSGDCPTGDSRCTPATTPSSACPTACR